MDELKKSGIQRLYLITYVVTFSIILFFRISQFGLLMTSASSKTSWYYILYTLATFLGIAVNLIVSFLCNFNKLLSIMWAIILVVISVVPNSFGFSLMSFPFLLIFLFINNAKFVNPTDLMKCDFWMRVGIFIVTVSMYIFNLYPSGTTVAVISRSDDLSILRYSFGFIHANSLAIFILSMILSYSMAYIKEKSRKHLVIISSICVITFIFTDSRVFLGIFPILILALLFYRFSIAKFLVSKITILVITVSMICGCIYLYLPYLGENLITILNTITSNRLSIGIQAFEYYPLKWTGYISTPLLDIYGVNIDDMYMAYMLRFGIIGFLVFQGYIYYCGILSKKSNNYLGNIAMIIISISIITINSNILLAPMMFIVSTYYNRRETNDEQVE
ncbi:hypothetical protein AKUA2003_12420 [Apilactobacillus kunkeei]|nr:hypothetical protein AKUA1001_12450 [Apilactobacillus kunkeei]CAI2648903.1 hypothetical protein AKUA2003_12420 [Apilactobacillus kunkeei]CAI2803188.1 hypothetical protein AKUA2002_12440 [Apilactobacillus kunkeei]